MQRIYDGSDTGTILEENKTKIAYLEAIEAIVVTQEPGSCVGQFALHISPQLPVSSNQQDRYICDLGVVPDIDLTCSCEFGQALVQLTADPQAISAVLHISSYQHLPSPGTTSPRQPVAVVVGLVQKPSRMSPLISPCQNAIPIDIDSGT